MVLAHRTPQRVESRKGGAMPQMLRALRWLVATSASTALSVAFSILVLPSSQALAFTDSVSVRVDAIRNTGGVYDGTNEGQWGLAQKPEYYAIVSFILVEGGADVARVDCGQSTWVED